MIPIQTLLALLAALVLMSCSQESPPRSELDKLTRQAAAKTTPETGAAHPSPTDAPPVDVIKDPTIHVKPDQDGKETELNPETSVLSIDASDAKELKFKVVGLDAQRLFALLEIEPKLEKIDQDKVFSKIGEHVQCIQNGLSLYHCSLTIAVVDGEITQIQDPKKIKSKPGFALYHPQKQIVGTYFNFNANVETGDQATPYFQINLYAQNAKQVFDALKVGDVDGRKRGKRVNCLRDMKLDPSDSNAYSCILYGNLTTGAFDEIK